jgi:alpha-ketoglutarate-dependent taurine dioxygenase
MSGNRRPIADASVWTARDFGETRGWATPLTAAMVLEIEAAMADARDRGLAWDRLEAGDCPLPETAPALAEARRALESGQGFAVLSGFPAERYDRADNLLAFAIVASHIGDITVQTRGGDKIIDVVDIGLPYDHTSRGYSSNKTLPFHTDGADVVGLDCLGVAQGGGSSILVSASAVYNSLLAERPDLLAILERGFHHHRRGEQEPGEPAVSPARIPVFSFHGGLLHCMYNRNPIMWAEKGGITLGEAEIAALNLFDAVVARPEMQLHMDLQVGDMQFANNFIVLHSRTEYTDGLDRRRHLLRVWLHLPQGRRRGPTLLDLYAPASTRPARR